ncbi:MAG: hypothetical protein ACE5G0_06295 [Rhodothermales bacterium]
METHIPVADTGVRVRPVRTRRDLKHFIDLPYSLYKNTPAWVPPLRQDTAHTLNPKKNPFFEHGQIQPFLAEDRAGNVVGRIAGIVNGMHLKKYDDGNGFVGFFECEKRYETAAALLDAACAWLRDQGLTGARGPASPSLNDTSGLLVDGFDREPSILMPYNPPYYEDFLVQYGFERVMTMWAYFVHQKYAKTDKLQRGVRIVYRRNPGLKLRTLDMSRFDEEARIILDIFNEAWADNWGHVPMTEAEFRRLTSDLKQIVDPRMVFILENDGEPVAFSICLPNLNLALKQIPNGRLFPTGLLKLLAYDKAGGFREVRMPLMGVRKAYHGRAFDTIPVLATIENGPKYGYTACEMSWVLDSNHVLKNALDAMGAAIDKEYALYEKSL